MAPTTDETIKARRKFYQDEDARLGGAFQSNLPFSAVIMEDLASTKATVDLEEADLRKVLFDFPATTRQRRGTSDHWQRPQSTSERVTAFESLSSELDQPLASTVGASCGIGKQNVGLHSGTIPVHL